jgi:phage baseplate assembly protein W
MTISLTFNAPTVPDQAEATFGRLRIPVNAVLLGTTQFQTVSSVQFQSTLGTSSIDYGSDVLTFPGVDPNLTLSKGGRVLAEALARRLCTPRGSLPFHEDYGLDLRSFLNEAVTSDSLYRLKSAVERECEADERVESASVSLDYNAQTRRLRVRIEATTAQGPFRLTLAVSQVTVELLTEA